MKKFLSLILCMLLCFIPTSSLKDVFAEENIISENVKSYILIDYYTGTPLLEHNSNDRNEIASMVKLMTSLLTLESLEQGKITLDTKFLVSDYAANMEGSEAFLEPNKEYTVDELLKTVIVASANDSSVVLAENIAGSESNFVKMMNDKAKELNMKDTLYANATGLPSTIQYSTAHDVSLILKEIIKYPTYFKYSNIWMDNLTHYDGRITELVNTNRLIRQYPGCDIGKTGFTDEAGYCLSASAQKNNMRLISVAIGCESAKDRFTVSEKLLNYGFNNYENRKIIDKKDVIENEVLVNGSKNSMLELEYERDYYYLNKKGEDNNIQIKIDLPKNVSAPIKIGDVIGKVYLTKDGVIVDEMNILSKTSCDKLTYKDSLDLIFDNWVFNA